MTIQRKRVAKRLASGLLAGAMALGGLAISGASPASAANAVTPTRLSGADRYATALDIADEITATDLVLVNGENYPDALAASALAHQEGAEILLVPSSGVLSAATIAAIIAENPTNTYIVGGPSALPLTVETQLTTSVALGGAGLSATSLKRLGGANRYETSSMVANEIGTVGSFNTKRTAIVVSGENFADAVLAGAAAWGPAGATNRHPIFLVQKDAVPAASLVTMLNKGVQQVIIIGGTSVVSDSVKTSLEGAGMSVIRVAGENRYATAASLATVLTTPVLGGGFGWSAANVGLANLNQAGGGADALAAAPYLGANNRVLLGVNGPNMPAETAAWITGKAGTINALTVIGGTSAVSADMVDAAIVAAGGSVDAVTAAIAAVEGRTTFTLTFSEAVNTTVTGNPVVVIKGATAASVATTLTWNTAKTVATATLASGALAAGDSITLLSNASHNIATSDGRKVTGASFSVAADTTAPTATLLASVSTGASALSISFSEPVKAAADVDTLAELAGVFKQGTTALGTPDSIVAKSGGVVVAGTDYDLNAFDSLTILYTTTPATFVAGSTISVAADTFTDLAVAANKTAAASTTVASDVTAPTVVGQPTFTVAATTSASLVVEGLIFTAKSAGYAGNAVTVEVIAATGAAPAVTVAGSAITINGKTGLSTLKEMADAINATPSAAALVTATFAGSASASFTNTVAAATNLAGGTSTMTVTTSFSEPVSAVVGDVKYEDGAVAGGSISAATITITGATVVTTYVLDGSATKVAPTLGTSDIEYAATITDVALNPMTAVDKLLAV